MNQEPTREERAFEALIVQSLTQAQKDDVVIEQIRESNEKERAALRMVMSGFLQRLVQGDVVVPREECNDDEAVLAGGTGEALFRCEGVGDQTAKELEKADQEIIQRRKKKPHVNES